MKELTRISHSSKTILDLVFYNYPEEIFDVNAVEDFSSDHLAVSFSMLTKLKRLKKSGRTVYNLKKADLSGLKSTLRNLSWDIVVIDNDIDASTACWYDMSGMKCLKNICKLNILDYVSFRSCTKPLRNVDH